MKLYINVKNYKEYTAKDICILFEVCRKIISVIMLIIFSNCVYASLTFVRPHISELNHIQCIIACIASIPIAINYIKY